MNKPIYSDFNGEKMSALDGDGGIDWASVGEDALGSILGIGTNWANATIARDHKTPMPNTNSNGNTPPPANNGGGTDPLLLAALFGQRNNGSDEPDNTLLYVGLGFGLLVILGIVIFLMKK